MILNKNDNSLLNPKRSTDGSPRGYKNGERMIEVKISGVNTSYGILNNKSEMRNSSVRSSMNSQLKNSGRKSTKSHGGGALPDSDDDDDQVDMDKLFPKPIHKQKEAVMYGRALNKLKTILHSKGLKDSSAVISNNNYGLLHFHIEAPDNNIQLSKFDTKSPLAAKLFPT